MCAQAPIGDVARGASGEPRGGGARGRASGTILFARRTPAGPARTPCAPTCFPGRVGRASGTILFTRQTPAGCAPTRSSLGSWQAPSHSVQELLAHQTRSRSPSPSLTRVNRVGPRPIQSRRPFDVPGVGFAETRNALRPAGTSGGRRRSRRAGRLVALRTPHQLAQLTDDAPRIRSRPGVGPRAMPVGPNWAPVCSPKPGSHFGPGVLGSVQKGPAGPTRVTPAALQWRITAPVLSSIATRIAQSSSSR